MRPARALLLGVVIAGLAATLGPVMAQPADGQKEFIEVARVLQSPRCKNCHPAGDRPLRGDHGDVHAMNISRRSNAAGLECKACHRDHNAPMPHGPPGVHGWRMPSAEVPLVFEGLTPGQLCRQMVDPAKNGGRTLAKLEAHMDHDELVLWGWEPGPGRSVPPLSHADFMNHVHAWIAAGAPCPP